MNAARLLALGAALAAALCVPLLPDGPSSSARASAAAPALAVADGPLGLAGGRVAPNLLLNLALNYTDAGAAYRGSYSSATEYAGYFNPRMCYSYPMQERPGGAPEPVLGDGGYFSIDAPADARHECAPAAFSGNFLNWASASTLDLVRYGLTGGDRVIDEAGLTVLQRAWLPDARVHPAFHAGDGQFPAKVLGAAARVTPFGDGTLYIASCRNRIVFSSAGPASCEGGPAAGKQLGQFNVRVRVCSDADAASRPDLCSKYAGGFKPEGTIQRYSAHLRIGVMSYLAGAGGRSYGGVLRAPLKFTGATAAEAPGFALAANGAPEWNPGSGVLEPNPDRAPGGASGAINYINRFGRGDPARPGAYPDGDPGAELYYEAMRYLQGRAPSAAAAAIDAGFPAWDGRADPVTAACQRNAVATIGHASFGADRSVPGNTRVDRASRARPADDFAPAPAFDVMLAARQVGAMEADPGGTYANPAPRPGLLALDTLDAGPAGAGSFYLAGAAWWAHTRQVRPDLPLRLHSYALELGAGTLPGAGPSALQLAAKYGAFDDRNGDANPFKTSGGAPHSEWSADGATPSAWFDGTDPHAIVGAVRALFAAAAARSGRVPGVVAGARENGAAFVLETSHEQAGWSGSLRRRAVDAGRGGPALAAAPLWDAGDLLAGSGSAGAPRPAPAQRQIYTLVHQADQSTATAAFTWDSLPFEQRAYLDLDPGTGARDGLGQARTAFLRGERDRELGRAGGVFRRRSGVLGDSVRAAPLLVGAPPASGSGDGYAAFHARYKGRRSAVYLGANDGMLHAFDAADGAELFAYVPQALVPALNQLTSPDYRHRAYVDATPGHGEANIGGNWRTVLVSGMGQGARGVFALDASDPAAFGAGLGALWEFTDSDDPAMGHVSAPPLVAKLKTGMRGKAPAYRYFAVVASGINNYGPGSARQDAGGALFLLALDKPASRRWQLGVDYYRFDTPAPDAALANALGAPALAVGADGAARFAWAGDLQGNLWRFDFTGAAPWPNAMGQGGARRPLFVARDGTGQRQPIAHAPRVAFAPGGGYLVMFGTGKLVEAADLAPPLFAPQSFYAVHDGAAGALAPIGGRAELAPRTFEAAQAGALVIEGQRFAYSGPDARRGWYFDFPAGAGGERLAGSAALAGAVLLVDSVAPGGDACAAPLARHYVIDSLSGLAPGAGGSAASGAMTGAPGPGPASGAAPLLFELGAASGPRDPTGRAAGTRTVGVLRFGADGAAPTLQTLTLPTPARRVGWREVANWEELHQAATK